MLNVVVTNWRKTNLLQLDETGVVVGRQEVMKGVKGTSFVSPSLLLIGDYSAGESKVVLYDIHKGKVHLAFTSKDMMYTVHKFPLLCVMVHGAQQIWDISDPENPKQLMDFKSIGVLKEDFAFRGEGKETQLVTFCPTSPHLVSPWNGEMKKLYDINRQEVFDMAFWNEGFIIFYRNISGKNEFAFFPNRVLGKGEEKKVEVRARTEEKKDGEVPSYRSPSSSQENKALMTKVFSPSVSKIHPLVCGHLLITDGGGSAALMTPDFKVVLMHSFQGITTSSHYIAVENRTGSSDSELNIYDTAKSLDFAPAGKMSFSQVFPLAKKIKTSWEKIDYVKLVEGLEVKDSGKVLFHKFDKMYIVTVKPKEGETTEVDMTNIFPLTSEYYVPPRSDSKEAGFVCVDATDASILCACESSAATVPGPVPEPSESQLKIDWTKTAVTVELKPKDVDQRS